ncbi:hypothetical protein B296_00034690 [Ensete ventricosum]|uniref:Uncharacterized protein n=1 Tax=Ensete ventricosum TaxID=4639 RepID=A0A426YU14_ENSVE|nr:hypothetical protein B296_00034690 [Ensete ventricosum]
MRDCGRGKKIRAAVGEHRRRWRKRRSRLPWKRALMLLPRGGRSQCGRSKRGGGSRRLWVRWGRRRKRHLLFTERRGRGRGRDADENWLKR